MADMERIMGTLEGELSAPATLDAALTLEHIVAPIPEGYIKPEGTVAITENGTVDVTEYAEAAVDVPIPEIVPLEVTANGTYTAPEGTAYSPITVDVEEVEPPSDGKTHIWIQIDENTPANRLTFTLRWKQTVNNGVQVDWGDGSDPETYAGTSAADHDHTYPGAGEYEITLEVLSGTVSFAGSSSYAIYGNAGVSNLYKANRIRKVMIGNGITRVWPYMFYNCRQMSMVTISDNPQFQFIQYNAFQDCYALTTVKLPEGIDDLNDYTFNRCYGLTSIRIPESVTEIGKYTFEECRSLTSVTIPKNVNKIKLRAFYSCTGLGRMRFEPTTPPTVDASNTFAFIPTDCVISVPVGSLEAYTSAANYPSASTYTYVEE